MILRRKKPCPFWLNDKNSFCCVLHCSSLFDQFVSLQTNHHYTFLQSIPRDLKVSLNWMQYPTSQNMADLVGDDFPEKKQPFIWASPEWEGGQGPNWLRHFFILTFISKVKKLPKLHAEAGGQLGQSPNQRVFLWEVFPQFSKHLKIGLQW